jgi:serine/threonine protein kinase
MNILDAVKNPYNMKEYVQHIPYNQKKCLKCVKLLETKNSTIYEYGDYIVKRKKTTKDVKIIGRTTIAIISPIIESVIGTYLTEFYDDCKHITKYNSSWFHDKYIYIEMEKLDGNMEDFITKYMSYTKFEEMMFQISCTLKFLQLHEICHQDLNQKNIMWKKTHYTEDYFVYKIQGKTYYVKNNGFMFKLIDLDFSCMYQRNLNIISEHILSEEFDKTHNISCGFKESYDSIFTMTVVWDLLIRMTDKEKNSYKIGILRKCRGFVNNMCNIYTGITVRPLTTILNKRPPHKYNSLSGDILSCFSYYKEFPGSSKTYKTICNF